MFEMSAGNESVAKRQKVIKRVSAAIKSAFLCNK